MTMPNTVSTRVYQFNSNSFWVIAVYFILFLVYFSQLMTMSTAGIILFGSILVGIPLYVRYGNNENIKLRGWDKRPLIFSSAGIQFGLDHYPVQGMETAAIFLESFTGFEYRNWVGTRWSIFLYIRRMEMAIRFHFATRAKWWILHFVCPATRSFACSAR